MSHDSCVKSLNNPITSYLPYTTLCDQILSFFIYSICAIAAHPYVTPEFVGMKTPNMTFISSVFIDRERWPLQGVFAELHCRRRSPRSMANWHWCEVKRLFTYPKPGALSVLSCQYVVEKDYQCRITQEQGKTGVHILFLFMAWPQNVPGEKMVLAVPVSSTSKACFTDLLWVPDRVVLFICR